MLLVLLPCHYYYYHPQVGGRGYSHQALWLSGFPQLRGCLSPAHLPTYSHPPPLPRLSLLPHNLMGEGQHSLAQPIVQCPLNLGWGGGRRGRGCQLYADIPQPS